MKLIYQGKSKVTTKRKRIINGSKYVKNKIIKFNNF